MHILRFMLLFATLLSLLPLHPAAAAAADSLEELKNEQVVKNLTTLLKTSGKDIGGALLGSGVRITVWTLICGVGGLILGIVAWHTARKRNYLEAPWNGYRYIKWMWFVLFAGSFMFFGGCGGFWQGAGSSAKQAIVKDQLVNKMVANVFCAFAINATEYELTGHETAAEVEALLEQSRAKAEEAEAAFDQDVNQLLTQAYERGTLSDWQYKLVRLLPIDTLVKTFLGDKGDHVLAAVPFMYAYAQGQKGFEELGAKNPAVLHLVNEGMARIEKKSMVTVHVTVYGNLFTSLALGVGIPIGLLAMFRLVVRLAQRKVPPVGYVPPPPANQ
jgi:hypothetical protein